MRFVETALRGAYVVELEERSDDRGFFARTFCVREFEAQGLNTRISQCNLSYNRRRGTLRGLHYQAEPAGEAKLIRCIAGAVHQVLVDMRPQSATYLRHVAVELSAANRLAVYLPEFVAAGIQTLEDDTSLMYQVSEFHTPEAERGVRFDDPAIGISWPLPVTEISDKDAAWAYLERGGPS
ncbi:MAG: dTDP-4-dehydrorhamnose 3,5-epimerase family protein [Candidatus Limnocylindrales bacterium]